MPAKIDMHGKVFGRLTVVHEHDPLGSRRSPAWLCWCECGNMMHTTGENLRSGNTKSCGCLNVDTAAARARVHGLCHTAEYHVWQSMLARCYNRSNAAYKDYGGRGIVVCPAWRVSFVAFYRDMGPRPAADYSLERGNNDRGYYKANCRWATRIEQANNRRGCRPLTFRGQTLTPAQWSRVVGTSSSNIRRRLDVLGWTVGEALGFIRRRRKST